MHNDCHSQFGTANARRFTRGIMEWNDVLWGNVMIPRPSRNHILYAAAFVRAQIITRVNPSAVNNL